MWGRASIHVWNVPYETPGTPSLEQPESCSISNPLLWGESSRDHPLQLGKEKQKKRSEKA